MMFLSNKKCVISAIFLFFAIVIGISGYRCYKKNPKNIFYNSKNSNVEVKATDGKQSSFGTAVFIGDIRNKKLRI